jgi:hypothetical protein
MAETDLTADAERATKRIVDQLAQLQALPEDDELNRLIALALVDAFNAGVRLAFGELAAAVIEQLRQKAPHVQLDPILTTGEADLRGFLQRELDARADD